VNITDIDLKSLEVLEALVAERNVTRAARKVGLSQPAVSNTLSRLRKLLGDPLLVRTSQGMVPTSRAESLVGPIRSAMEALKGALAPSPAFEPATAKSRFLLAATDYAAWLCLPPLCAELARRAPHVRLEAGPLTERVPSRGLERGEVDLALGFFPDPPESLYQQELFQEDFVAVVSRGSPHAKGKMTLSRFTELRHLIVSPWGGVVGTLDAALAGAGVARTVFVSLTHFLVAPAIAAETDLVVTLPRRLAKSFERTYPLSLVELPLALPSLSFRQLWHERTHHERAHAWLRSVIAERAVSIK
jgi:DNA-binding transcriptional LysR family regulator